MASGGKGARKRQKDKRRALKRARKTAMTAQYESWRDAGTNGKSKRNKLRSKRSKKAHTKHQHIVSPCGNPGCGHCHHREKNFVRANPGLFVEMGKVGTTSVFARKTDVAKALEMGKVMLATMPAIPDNADYP